MNLDAPPPTNLEMDKKQRGRENTRDDPEESKAEINTGQHQTHNESIDCTGNWLQP